MKKKNGTDEMDKYFQTLNEVFNLYYQSGDPRLIKQKMLIALALKHDVSGESGYIIGVWKKNLNIEKFNETAKEAIGSI